jgi:hypothetical protein
MPSTLDQAVIDALTVASSRAVVAQGDFSASNSQAMAQLGLLIASNNLKETTLLTGFLASQLFNLGAMESKLAYNSPVQSGGGPVPAQTAVAK